MANAEIARQTSLRLEAVKEVWGLENNYQLADLIGGVKYSRVTNWLNGFMPPVDAMSRLCDNTGLTLDWLYRERFETLQARHGDKLREALRRLRR